MCRKFGVGTKLTDIIAYSTVYKYFNLINESKKKITRELYELNLYSDEALIKTFKYNEDYISRIDLMTKLLQ